MKLPLRVVVAVLDALMKFRMHSQDFLWTLVLSQSLGFLYSDVSVFEYPRFQYFVEIHNFDSTR